MSDLKIWLSLFLVGENRRGQAPIGWCSTFSGADVVFSRSMWSAAAHPAALSLISEHGMMYGMLMNKLWSARRQQLQQEHLFVSGCADASFHCDSWLSNENSHSYDKVTPRPSYCMSMVVLLCSDGFGLTGIGTFVNKVSRVSMKWCDTGLFMGFMWAKKIVPFRTYSGVHWKRRARSKTTPYRRSQRSGNCYFCRL